MNVRTLCLSILSEGEATGYEIRRLCVEGECSYFVEASFGSIYPALAKLEGDGLVTSRVEAQPGKPAKKIYAITDAGRAAFVDSLFEPLGDDIFRSPFLLFARVAHLLPATLVEQRMRERLVTSAEGIQKLRDLAKDETLHAADAWVIRYGLTCMEIAHRHMEAHMHELVALAKAEPDSKLAAE
jgi:DNA-binding PadR family transcriptional regulator